jgi:hypothetical protein
MPVPAGLARFAADQQPRLVSDRRQVTVLNTQLSRQGTPSAMPQIAQQRSDFLSDQAVAFDGEFHRFGGLGPKVGLVHNGIPFQES